MARTESVIVRAGEASLDGDLDIPTRARGIVLFAHGSGSSRASPRNRAVADVLVAAGFATLLFDLLAPAEYHRRFEIPLLGRRLIGATDWVAQRDHVRDLPIGYFGASTGAAAALYAAAARPALVRAVVSRGGRPDLAGAALARVRAPTLLIVGGADHEVLALNEAAREQIGGTADLRIVPGAGHLFEEPGTLAEVVRLAAEWFRRELSIPSTRFRDAGV